MITDCTEVICLKDMLEETLVADCLLHCTALKLIQANVSKCS